MHPGPTRRGSRGDNDRRAIVGPIGFRGPIEMTLRNQYVENRRPFFLEITSKSGQNCGIFPVCFGVHKTGNA